MESSRTAITENQIPSITTCSTHIITVSGGKFLPTSQGNGNIMKCKSICSINVAVAALHQTFF